MDFIFPSNCRFHRYFERFMAALCHQDFEERYRRSLCLIKKFLEDIMIVNAPFTCVELLGKICAVSYMIKLCVDKIGIKICVIDIIPIGKFSAIALLFEYLIEVRKGFCFFWFFN